MVMEGRDASFDAIHKTALITGATAGIGFQVAKALSTLGMSVIVTGRDVVRGQQAVEELSTHAGHKRIHFFPADASLVSRNVRLAELVAQRVDHLDVLVNNVGGVHDRRIETREGIESTMALNFVGPLTLALQLLPLLAKGKQARMVSVISSAFEMWKEDPLHDLNADERYVGIEAYGHAKLLNLLATLALSRRLAAIQVAVNAVNPGMAWTPGVAALTPRAVPQWRFVWPMVRWMQRRASVEKAALGPVFVATALSSTHSGKYFEGEKERALPEQWLDTTVQDRALTAAESLISEALSGQ
jgi:NAD(P)-dependent dehydrogenase (short-subunit alcohol dehydrogenase family)